EERVPRRRRRVGARPARRLPRRGAARRHPLHPARRGREPLLPAVRPAAHARLAERPAAGRRRAPRPARLLAHGRVLRPRCAAGRVPADRRSARRLTPATPRYRHGFGVESCGQPRRRVHMAEELLIGRNRDRVRLRSPWAVALLPFITLGIYHLVWWYR